MNIDIETKHADMVRQLVKSGDRIVAEINPASADLWHAATGIASEGGELLDAAKKVTVYGQSPNRENFVEELGDMEFYLQQLRSNLGITREETLAANMAKLAKRYPNYQYSNEAAKARADKLETSGA